MARKEVENGTPILRLYIEPSPDLEHVDEEIITTLIHEEFKNLSQDYKDLETYIGFKPLRVTMVPSGGFANYTAQKQAAGADLAHLKAPHMNPSDSILQAVMGEQFVPGMVPSASTRKVKQG